MKKQGRSSNVPTCPNHGEALILSVGDRNKLSGSSPCPVSNCLFDWKRDGTKTSERKDKYGRPIIDREFITEGEERDQ